RYNQSRGLHTVQRDYGCDLLSDGSARGSDRFGYDGRDFISFDPGSWSFVAADSTAQVTTRHWNNDGVMVEHWMNYLEHICPDALWRFIGYGQEVLERK
ncbi:HA1F protein, partial [Dyaphorophyia castanea]|nr:HA1F protein [Platysteira castanea]